MAIYRVYSLNNDDYLFSKVSKTSKKIDHPTFRRFSISNGADYIVCEGKHELQLPFSTEENILMGDVEIKVIIARYRFPYAIVGLSGRGLLAVHGISKFTDSQILNPISDHLKKEYDISIKFSPFNFENGHFSKYYWGEKITSKYGYNSNNKMYLKISGSDVNKLLENNSTLNGYYENGTIKSIQGYVDDLEQVVEGVRYPGRYKFDSQGNFSWDSPDIGFFNGFVKTMIDKGFFGGGSIARR